MISIAHLTRESVSLRYRTPVVLARLYSAQVGLAVMLTTCQGRKSLRSVFCQSLTSHRYVGANAVLLSTEMAMQFETTVRQAFSTEAVPLNSTNIRNGAMHAKC